MVSFEFFCVLCYEDVMCDSGIVGILFFVLLMFDLEFFDREGIEIGCWFIGVNGFFDGSIFFLMCLLFVSDFLVMDVMNFFGFELDFLLIDD